ncbi:UNVERIFIED_CONTAM: hypothetical protein Sradi_0691000 [Sesamum radiatum]|uniref:Uncharacterized protein n=1 Tax=Sesamum radiatum TaxID=300843 RepID=A0AAW2VRF8_SESRA
MTIFRKIHVEISPGRPVRSSQGCWRSQHARHPTSSMQQPRDYSNSDLQRLTTMPLRELAANSEPAAISRSRESAVAK